MKSDKPKLATLSVVSEGVSDPSIEEQLKKTCERFIHLGKRDAIKSKTNNGKPVLKLVD